jgi:proteasome lid subunit RPN8/RPN11
MRWQDQSETLTLPPAAAFLATLSPTDSARFDQPDNAHPRIAITQGCFDAITLHLNASRDELGGLLVGQAYAGADGTLQIIAANHGVESRAFDSTGVSLRMETEVWNSARPLLDRGAAVVGWYHSHPDLGAFFSDTDRTTQRSFFRQVFSIGIVIDPIRKELKAFLGPDCVEIPPENVIVTAWA